MTRPDQLRLSMARIVAAPPIGQTMTLSRAALGLACLPHRGRFDGQGISRLFTRRLRVSAVRRRRTVDEVSVAAADASAMAVATHADRRPGRWASGLQSIRRDVTTAMEQYADREPTVGVDPEERLAWWGNGAMAVGHSAQRRMGQCRRRPAQRRMG